MSVNNCVGELLFELFEQNKQRLFLRLVSRVGRLAVGSQSASVAHAYTMGVMPCTMGALLLDGATCLNFSCQCDKEMITDGFPSKLAMPTSNVRYSNDLIRECSGTMDDDFIDCSHLSSGF